jgi:hypothetical protein
MPPRTAEEAAAPSARGGGGGLVRTALDRFLLAIAVWASGAGGGGAEGRAVRRDRRRQSR